jgi:hypothetical protein
MVTAACGSGVAGVWGVAPNARIMPILITKDNGCASPDAIVKGIEWAISHNATVINLSIGNVNSNQLITNAIQLAFVKHIIVVAAAGDYGEAGVLFPASLPGVISVGAKDKNGDLLPISNYSPDISIVTLGSDISVLSIDKNNNNIIICKKIDGTSVATATISGLIALALDVKKPLSTKTIVNALKYSQDNNIFINSETFLKRINNKEDSN